MKFIFIVVIFSLTLFFIKIINGEIIDEDYTLDKSIFINGDLYIINNRSKEIKIETKPNYNITVMVR